MDCIVITTLSDVKNDLTLPLIHTYTHIHSPPTLSTNANAASHVFLLLVTYVHPPWMQYGWTALMRAAQTSHLQITQALLKSGANADLQNNVRRGRQCRARVSAVRARCMHSGLGVD